MNQQKCLVCDKHENGQHVTYKDEMIYVSPYIKNPEEDTNYLGYYFIESTRHFRGMYDATDDEMKSIGKMMKNLSKVLKNLLDAEHVYAFVFGDGVAHLHVHIVVRHRGAPKEYWGTSVDEWPDAPKGSINEIELLNQRVKEELNKM